MTYSVLFAPEARSDLRHIRQYIQAELNAAVAGKFVAGLRSYCLELGTFPHRGIERGHILPGLRVIGYRRRVAIHFVVEDGAVSVLRLTYAGSNWLEDYSE
jgi:toxin ParE1/3/4